MAALIHPRKVEAAAPAKGCDLLSHFTIDKLETDNAGTLLHGWADFTLRGHLIIDGSAND